MTKKSETGTQGVRANEPSRVPFSDYPKIDLNVGVSLLRKSTIPGVVKNGALELSMRKAETKRTQKCDIIFPVVKWIPLKSLSS